jgi:hypothetical protein
MHGLLAAIEKMVPKLMASARPVPEAPPQVAVAPTHAPALTPAPAPTPAPASLTPGTTNRWSIQEMDQYGNTSSNQTDYTP